MRISTNFLLSEFVPDGREVSPIQVFMLQNLCIKILEPIRAFCKCSIKISNGMRFPSDINRLRKAGYNPSETSDHLFGNVVRVKSLPKKAKYGAYYAFSVGAADCIPSIGAKAVWEKVNPYFNKAEGTIELPTGKIKVGQFILEKRNGYWLHISNPASLIYSTKFDKRFLNRTPFLYSDDNGKTYKIFKG